MQDYSYVSLRAWAGSIGDRERAGILSESLGIDAYRARELSRRTVPCIVARLHHEPATRAAEALSRRAVGASVHRHAELRARLTPPIARRIEIRGSEMEAMLFRGGAVVRGCADVVLAARAHVRSQHRPGAGAFTHQLQGTLGAEAWMDQSVRRQGLGVSEVLDIHFRQGDTVRVEAGHFDVECLGADRGATPAANMDCLLRRVEDATGRAIGDHGFEQARFLAEFVGDFTDVSDRDARGHGAYALYSAWRSAMVLQEVGGRGAHAGG